GMDLGGGHGIACFAEDSDAQRVRDAQGFLPNELLDRITSLEPLDLAEARNRAELLDEPEAEADFEGHLEKILNTVDETLPAAGERLRSVRLQVAMSSEGSVLLAFYRERIRLPENCAYVQLAYQKMRTAE